MKEIDLFDCIAKINKELLVVQLNTAKEKPKTNLTFSTRSQGKLQQYPDAPIIFTWCYKWELNNEKHELTFEIWKDEQWRLRSEHNTEDKYDFENPLKGEFLYDYHYNNTTEMMEDIEQIKTAFLNNFTELFSLKKVE